MDLNQHVVSIADGMRAAAQEAGLTLAVQPAGRPLQTSANDYALGRVYRNLIQNAIQATAPGGTITVTATPMDGVARISVADSGIGIPPERLTTIFDDYVTTKRRGLGLGLAISKRLVEQLGGRIAVRSEVGKGTVFTVELPLSVAAGSAEAAASGAALGAQIV
jgi:signal transduction histidine kinase